MPLTRTHIAFLWVISILTGLIGPGTSTEFRALSYLMTDVWLETSVLLFLLIIAFYLAAKRSWKGYKIATTVIILGLAYILGTTIFGSIYDKKTLAIANGLSWGWIFLFIGIFLMILAYRSPRKWAEEGFSENIDTVIGILWGFALSCIVSIIIISSASFFTERSKRNILEEFFWSGKLTYGTWYTLMKGAHEKIEWLNYERSHDYLSYMYSSWSTLKLFWREQGYSGVLDIKNERESSLIGNTLYSVDQSGQVYSWALYITGATWIEQNAGVLIKEKDAYTVSSDHGNWTFHYTGSIYNPLLSETKSTLAWTEKTWSGVQIVLQGKPIGKYYTYLETYSLSPSGRSIISLGTRSWQLLIEKNGDMVMSVDKKELRWFLSNGDNSLVLIERNGLFFLFFNNTLVGKDLEEVREIFLEKEWSTYAFFGRPLWVTKYCLYTRYKGNVCGLDGYMNPRLGADGSSVIFGGYKDKKWSLYRNTEMIVRDTGYTKENITNDYLFFDTTNPRTYLFAIKDTKNGTYSFLKNGKTLPGTWQDIGTDVSYGYDNHILTTVKDREGWKIIEL